MTEEASESGDYVPSMPAALEPGNQRELLHLLRECQDTQDPAVQAFLQPWIEALDKAKVSDVEGALAQAQLYEMAGMVGAALAQLGKIFDRMDQTAPENRTPEAKAVANLAIDMEEKLLR